MVSSAPKEMFKEGQFQKSPLPTPPPPPFLPKEKKFPERGERLLLPPLERPCMALLQYYNNAREISSSPPTPHPHNEIVIF